MKKSLKCFSFLGFIVSDYRQQKDPSVIFHSQHKAIFWRTNSDVFFKELSSLILSLHDEMAVEVGDITARLLINNSWSALEWEDLVLISKPARSPPLFVTHGLFMEHSRLPGESWLEKKHFMYKKGCVAVLWSGHLPGTRELSYSPWAKHAHEF